MAEKIITVVGTRPELIRLSEVISKLDDACNHIFVYTGQNYNKQLKDVFFRELDIRKPDYTLDATGSFGQQTAVLFKEIERILKQEEPNKFLVLGDTNSGLSAVIAKRMGIPVYHLEAGNRCYDDRVPEEVNRRIIDHSSDILMPYTERSRQNLLNEGIPNRKIFVIGNPIWEVIHNNWDNIVIRKILKTLNLEQDNYFLITLHRSENVDNLSRLSAFYNSFKLLFNRYKLPIIISTHPHTKINLERLNLLGNENIRILEPFGFFDFIELERNALCVLTDSGTVQEECAILQIPNVILRDTTERPETIECGSAITTGAEECRILQSVEQVIKRNTNKWEPPAGYNDINVSEKIVNILTSFYYKI
jgi:UDP-N-acetylglucosamine 2-epimerase (non-hydrolysing)